MAAKDLQIVRNRPIRLDEPLSGANSFDRAGTPDSMGFLLGVLRRQWALLIVAVIGSGVIAWFVSLEFQTRSYTVDLELQSQQLPGSNQNIYATPNADVAAEWLTSDGVLRRVVEKNGLPPVPYFARQLKVLANPKSGSITVTLAHSEKDAAKVILTDISESFADYVRERREQLLVKHADHLNNLLFEADRTLGLARIDFIKQKTEDLPAVLPNDDFRKNAELQALIDRRIQAEAGLSQISRNQGRILRNQRVVLQQIAEVRSSLLRDVLTGRQRQAENVAQHLTKSSRLASVKAKIQQQLAELKKELAATDPPSGAAPGVEASASTDATPMARNSAPQPNGEHAPNDKSGSETLEVGLVQETPPGNADTGDAVPDADVADKKLITDWIARVSAVGKETLGDLDDQTIDVIKEAQATLATLANESHKLQFDLDDNREELAYFETKEQELKSAIESLAASTSGTGTVGPAIQLSPKAMELESQLTFREARYAELSRQLDLVNQIKDYRLPEYVERRAADFVIDGEDSDRKKLFAMAFLGSGFILLIPSMVIELLRLRPTPIGVVSRKWNLPVLGIQSPRVNGGKPTRAVSVDLQHEFRLMALRIQQSLFRPKGRVVLFSGLDHEESPMVLIRALAKCFSQREESVLIIQTLPTQAESASGKPGRVGVAEFLAGEYDDASELVVGTGIAGIGFLPGGRAKCASEAMASSRLTSLIDQFRENYSMILLCGPSTLHPADLQMLAARADGIVFTVNKQSLHTVYGDEVIGDLIELGGSILGFAEQPNTTRKAFPSDPFQSEKESSIEVSRVRTVSA